MDEVCAGVHLGRYIGSRILNRRTGSESFGPLSGGDSYKYESAHIAALEERGHAFTGLDRLFFQDGINVIRQ